MYRIARVFLNRIDLLVLSMHPGVLQKYDIQSVRTVELTNGFSPDLLSREHQKSNEDRLRAVYIGHAKAERGTDGLIRAVGSVEPTIRLDIIGPTDEVIERTAIAYDNVTLHGERPHEETMEHVARADIAFCILDTSVENYRYAYPLKLFEYAALETAIVATDTPAIRSILTPEESVRLVHGQSDDRLRETITALAKNPKQRDELARNARAEIEPYSWSRILNSYSGVIEELLERDTSRGTEHGLG
jgi:glycosyltransferase involved in cell wall biosynthesis